MKGHKLASQICVSRHICHCILVPDTSVFDPQRLDTPVFTSHTQSSSKSGWLGTVHSCSFGTASLCR